MFKGIKKFFYSSLCKHTIPIEKYICIKKNVTFNPYIKPYKNLYIKSIFKDIIQYIDFIDNILDTDLSRRSIISPIDMNNISSTSLIEFFTDENKILKNRDEIWKIFITRAIDLQYLYEDNYKKVTSPVIYRNCLLMKPYLNNIDNIINIIMEEVNRERKYKQ